MESKLLPAANRLFDAVDIHPEKASREGSHLRRHVVQVLDHPVIDPPVQLVIRRGELNQRLEENA